MASACWYYMRLLKLRRVGCENYRLDHQICQTHHPYNPGEECGQARQNQGLIADLKKQRAEERSHKPGCLIGILFGILGLNKEDL